MKEEKITDIANEIKIREVIKAKVYELRIPLKELSRRTRIPYSTLFSWSEGRPPKDLVKAKRLAEYFQMSLDELLFGKSTRNSEYFKACISREMKKKVESFINSLDI